MKIVLIGYGKMGRSIEKIAVDRGHEVVLIIDHHNQELLTPAALKSANVAIEFSRPEAAFNNISTCIRAGIPIVSGTTGWLDKKQEVVDLCKELNGSCMYASNYSLGVNIFFQLNNYLAGLIRNFKEYKVSIEEIHHTQKLDAPSGTAITLAEGIIENNASLKSWVKGSTENQEAIPVYSLREDEVPGTHTIKYQSEVDSIEIKHTAFTREGFALGAVVAAEWIIDKKGFFSMQDLLGFEKPV